MIILHFLLSVRAKAPTLKLASDGRNARTSLLPRVSDSRRFNAHSRFSVADARSVVRSIVGLDLLRNDTSRHVSPVTRSSRMNDRCSYFSMKVSYESDSSVTRRANQCMVWVEGESIILGTKGIQE
jgi:hydroxyacyl-ACP dehydratase HTD2-like protein with hotdog domain